MSGNWICSVKGCVGGERKCSCLTVGKNKAMAGSAEQTSHHVKGNCVIDMEDGCIIVSPLPPPDFNFHTAT